MVVSPWQSFAWWLCSFPTFIWISLNLLSQSQSCCDFMPMKQKRTCPFDLSRALNCWYCCKGHLRPSKQSVYKVLRSFAFVCSSDEVRNFWFKWHVWLMIKLRCVWKVWKRGFGSKQLRWCWLLVPAWGQKMLLFQCCCLKGTDVAFNSWCWFI